MTKVSSKSSAAVAKVCGFVAAATVAVLLVASCGLPKNAPSYVKEIGAYQEGDGIAIWFALADDAGAYTTSDGTLVVEITETVSEWVGYELVDREHTLYRRQLQATADQFTETTVGRGAFERSVVLYSYGRVAK